MAIGLVGKAENTRLITGSVHYGERSTEKRNIDRSKRGRGRKVVILGQRGTYTETKRPHRSR